MGRHTAGERERRTQQERGRKREIGRHTAGERERKR